LITALQIPIGTLVRIVPDRLDIALNSSMAMKAASGKVGVLIAFDLWGKRNFLRGDPLVLWAGESLPIRMAGSALERVS
jgi:hypothetical protein